MMDLNKLLRPGNQWQKIERDLLIIELKYT